MKTALVIHGGCGRLDQYPKEELEQYHVALIDIRDAGVSALESGASAYEVVIECVKRLEDSPLFNAGRGSVFNDQGEIEMDACVMKCNLESGAVGGLRSIKNPILAAQKVLEKVPHRLLVGFAAEKWAISEGLAVENLEYFKVEKRWAQYLELSKQKRMDLDHGGTVGAVALDKDQKMAAATSTGGLTCKKAGRISDSAVMGAGTFAHSKTCALSATGTGDEFIRHTATYDVHAQMLYLGRSLKEASQETLSRVRETGGNGGIIGVDKEGSCSFAFVSEGMLHAWKNGEGWRGSFLTP